MRCQLRAALAVDLSAAAVHAIIEQIKTAAENTEGLLRLTRYQVSFKELKAWAAGDLNLLPVHQTHLANAIMDLRKARAAALQAVSEAVPSGT